MSLIVDIILFGLACLLFPGNRGQPRNGESSDRWIILDNQETNGRSIPEVSDQPESDPFLNGDYDGPDW